VIVKKAVPQQIYSTRYFESDCGGHEQWRDTRGMSLPPRLEMAWKIADIKRGMKVLDWGCGRGEMSYQAARVGADVLGLDYSQAAISMTKKLPRNVSGEMKFVRIKNLTIPAKDDSFDVILFIDVIEHLYPEQLDILFSEFPRVLKKSGRVILHTFPNLDHYDFGYPYFTRWMHMIINPVWQIIFHEKLRDLPSPRFGYDKKVHVNECTIEMVRQYLEKSGLAAKVWYDTSFRVMRLRDKIRYAVCQPLWLSQKYFADDIWAIAKKKRT